MPVVGAMRHAAASFADPDVRVRPALRLTPLALCIGLCLSARVQAQDMADDFSLCPITDTVPSFDDAPATGIQIGADRSKLPTDIESDTLTGTDVTPQFSGNVALRRGDQFLGLWYGERGE